MATTLHGSAHTTPRIPAGRQDSKEKTSTLARLYGLPRQGMHNNSPSRSLDQGRALSRKASDDARKYVARAGRAHARIGRHGTMIHRRAP